ncbi:PAN/Apple domain [Phytophthora cactorum]|nr:PAN/Apple domain [Phytophthora cactorum]
MCPGIDYVGNDIGNVRMLKPLGYCSSCLHFPGCRAFTFTTFNGGTCWLKRAKGSSTLQLARPSHIWKPRHVASNMASIMCEVWQAEPIRNTIRLLLQVHGQEWLQRLLVVELQERNVLAQEPRSVLSPFAIAAPEECVVENGFDYVGNDLFSVTSVDAFECCHQCQNFAAAGCRAFSWTDYQGGTCWLKTGRGTIAVNANAKSGTISTFRFAETGGMCWLKSVKGNMVVDLAAVSSQTYVEEPTCGLEDGVKYVGNDIGSARANNANECCALCEAFGGCRAFSWSGYQGGTCWFKNRKDEVSWEAGVYSGQVLSNPAAPSCALELHVDYTGSNVGNASSVNACGCCSICMKTVGCAAFSWTDLNGGTCYLKGEKGTRSFRPSFIVLTSCNTQLYFDT